MMKKAKSERKKREVAWEKVAGPALFGMGAQEDLPVLATWSSRTYLFHIFLDCAFADVKAQLEEFAADPFSSEDADSAPPFP